MRALWLNRLILLLSFAGIVVAGVLSLGHLMNVQIPCGPSGGCNTIASHPSSKWFGIPVAYFGFLSYAALATMAALRGSQGITKNRFLVMGGLLVAGIGTLTSAALTIYALTSIKAVCEWCLASAGIMTATFLVSAALAQEESGEDAKEVFFAPIVLGVIAFGILGVNAKNLSGATKLTGISMEKLQEAPVDTVIPNDRQMIGDKDAPVTIIEFADLTCGLCKDSYWTMKDTVAKYNGKLRWVFRHYPLYKKTDGAHPFSLEAAIIGETAANKGKFWAYLDGVFALDQNQIKSIDPFVQVAEALGIPRDVIESDLTDQESAAFNRVYEDLRLADSIGVNSTPTFLVVVQGERPVPASYAMLGEMLASEKFKRLLGVNGAQ
ncbi:MAG TPA: vitamin K epoxide reductase family protein [Fimbriimonadaceae bacterium]|nr:vitamin K epoxide reductase family protein [Fimbriimonadaceae bacterium]